MGCQLLQHLDVLYSLSEGHNNRCSGDIRYGGADLQEPLDERLQRLVRILPHNFGISFHTGAFVGTLIIGQELGQSSIEKCIATWGRFMS
jgi:hypothetical protein